MNLDSYEEVRIRPAFAFKIDLSRFSDKEKEIWSEFKTYIDRTLQVLNECVSQELKGEKIRSKCKPLWAEMVKWWEGIYVAIHQNHNASAANYPNHQEIYKMFGVLIEGLNTVVGWKESPEELIKDIEVMLKPYFQD